MGNNIKQLTNTKDYSSYLEKTLEKLFYDKYSLDFSKNNRFNKESVLLGKNIRMKVTDLLYIYKDIEEVFNIHISQDDIVEGKFTTFNNILHIIYKSKEI